MTAIRFSPKLVVSPTVPLVPVILCGGTGTRLWPLSRASYPKQYWGLAGLAPPLLICHDVHRFNCCAVADGYVPEQLRQIGVEPAWRQRRRGGW